MNDGKDSQTNMPTKNEQNARIWNAFRDRKIVDETLRKAAASVHNHQTHSSQ